MSAKVDRVREAIRAARRMTEVVHGQAAHLPWVAEPDSEGFWLRWVEGDIPSWPEVVYVRKEYYDGPAGGPRDGRDLGVYRQMEDGEITRKMMVHREDREVPLKPEWLDWVNASRPGLRWLKVG
jgi:hypothetical protein